MWDADRIVSLDAAHSAGIYAQPVSLQSPDQSPRIKSVMVINSGNVTVGVFRESAGGGKPSLTVAPNSFLVCPIGACRQVTFAFSAPSGAQQSGDIYLVATEDRLAASSGAVANATSAVFITDYSLLDSGATLS